MTKLTTTHTVTQQTTEMEIVLDSHTASDLLGGAIPANAKDVTFFWRIPYSAYFREGEEIAISEAHIRWRTT